MFQLKILTATAMLFALSACGTESSVTSQIQDSAMTDVRNQTSTQENPLEHATVVREVKVKVILGGFNPNYRGLAISGTVELGGNRCVAGGTTAKFSQEEKDGVLYLTPTLKLSEDSLRRICTMEYMPVFGKVSLDLRYDSSKISKVVIRNVEEMGQDRNADSFLN